MTAATLVRKARDLGVSTVQLGDNLPVDQLSDEELRDLRAAAVECGIELEVGTRGTKPSHLLRYLEVARFLGAQLVRTMAGVAWRHPVPCGSGDAAFEKSSRSSLKRAS